MDSSNIKRKESADTKRENVPEASVDNPDEHKSVADNRILLERLSDVGQFIHVRAEIWFWKIEAVFRIAGITDQKVMADAVIACLDQEVMLIVKDLVRKPPRVKPYQKLKNRIMRSCTTAAKTRLDKILEVRHDEHFKPSQMLREMHMINDGTLNESDIRTLFMQHMQERCRKILEASQITDVEQLACLADAVEDVLSR
ncbi:uncharacterized protein LOC108623971 [Ceratina calcarata]|uniref:Uncharacterized protein LOC108623971 n=1 Tax=Ceratina calcarata TaxID=156304 RepID=A0AAJ7IW07_9HYME|nr:uncharacterized protein LOC108623971 [Ceratina calcarata]